MPDYLPKGVSVRLLKRLLKGPPAPLERVK